MDSGLVTYHPDFLQDPTYSYHEGCSLKIALAETFKFRIKRMNFNRELGKMSSSNKINNLINRVACFDCIKEEMVKVRPSSEKLNKDIWELIYEHLLIILLR